MERTASRPHSAPAKRRAGIDWSWKLDSTRLDWTGWSDSGMVRQRAFPTACRARPLRPPSEARYAEARQRAQQKSPIAQSAAAEPQHARARSTHASTHLLTADRPPNCEAVEPGQSTAGRLLRKPAQPWSKIIRQCLMIFFAVAICVSRLWRRGNTCYSTRRHRSDCRSVSMHARTRWNEMD